MFIHFRLQLNLNFQLSNQVNFIFLFAYVEAAVCLGPHSPPPPKKKHDRDGKSKRKISFLFSSLKDAGNMKGRNYALRFQSVLFSEILGTKSPKFSKYNNESPQLSH